MVNFLIGKGADSNFEDNLGLRAIEHAILQGLYEIAYILYPLQSKKEFRNPD